MKAIITASLVMLYASSVFAAGGVKVNGDIVLEQGSEPSRVLYFSDGSSQQFASPWSFDGSNIYYSPAIPGNVGIGNAAPTEKLDVTGTVKATAFKGNGSALTNLSVTNFSGTLSGDVTGYQGSTKVTKIQGYPVSNSAPVTGDLLKFNGTTWVPAKVYSPRIATSETDSIVEISTACTNYLSVSITVPESGIIDVGASVSIYISHSLNTEDRSHIFIGSSNIDCSDNIGTSIYNVPSNYPSNYFNFTSTPRRVYTVNSAGTYTYYLNAQMFRGQNLYDNFWYGRLVATWYPNP